MLELVVDNLKRWTLTYCCKCRFNQLCKPLFPVSIYLSRSTWQLLLLRNCYAMRKIQTPRKWTNVLLFSSGIMAVCTKLNPETFSMRCYSIKNFVISQLILMSAVLRCIVVSYAVILSAFLGMRPRENVIRFRGWCLVVLNEEISFRQLIFSCF